MSLSNKKRSELYNSVADEIMDARIRIKGILDKTKLDPKTKDTIDDVLSDLCANAPKIAIDNFQPQNSSNP